MVLNVLCSTDWMRLYCSLPWSKNSCRIIRILYCFLSVDNQIQGWSKIVRLYFYSLKIGGVLKFGTISILILYFLLIPIILNSKLFYPQECRIPQYVAKYFQASVTCKYKMFLFTIQFRFYSEIVQGLL